MATKKGKSRTAAANAARRKQGPTKGTDYKNGRPVTAAAKAKRKKKKSSSGGTGRSSASAKHAELSAQRKSLLRKDSRLKSQQRSGNLSGKQQLVAGAKRNAIKKELKSIESEMKKTNAKIKKAKALEKTSTQKLKAMNTAHKKRTGKGSKSIKAAIDKKASNAAFKKRGNFLAGVLGVK